MALTPQFQRVTLDSGKIETHSVTVRSTHDLTIISASSECHCVTVSTRLPVKVEAGKSIPLDVSVSGVLPGIKTVTLQTSDGPLRFQVQIITQGLGAGNDILESILAKSAQERLTPWFLVHDLQGEARNCGCSDGSLGGVDVLAGLATIVSGKGVGARFLLSGDSDGQRPGLGAILQRFGWETDSEAIVVADDPVTAISDEKVVAVVCAATTSLQHRKLIRPLAGGGMVAEVLLVDDSRRIQEVISLPIDRSLPKDPRILAQLAAIKSFTLEDQSAPSETCKSCHASAYQAWAASRHAVAIDSLPVEDRTDDCIVCHSFQIGDSPSRRIADVQCQSCHMGADAHAREPERIRSKGTVDCRSCHDARRHPGFDPQAAWRVIQHGR
jgi:hypothetical protein